MRTADPRSLTVSVGYLAILDAPTGSQTTISVPVASESVNKSLRPVSYVSISVFVPGADFGALDGFVEPDLLDRHDAR